MVTETNLKKECDVLGEQLAINPGFLAYFVLSKLTKDRHIYLDLEKIKRSQARFELREFVQKLAIDLYNRKATQNRNGLTTLDWWENHFYFYLREKLSAKDDRISFLKSVLDEIQIPYHY